MIIGDKFILPCYIILFFFTFIDLVIPIHPAFMTVIFTAILVFIGSLLSSKIFTEIPKEEIQSMKQKDALLFPVYGSIVLFGLFVIINYINKDYVNILFRFYFTFLGACSIGSLINEKICDKKEFKKYTTDVLFTIPEITFINEKKIDVNKLDIMTFCLGMIVGLLYFFFENWYLNNILGIAFCVFGIENLLLGKYQIGLILLVLLFFYDIFWVFFTPVMVTVAKNIKGPIKLMFPKKLNPVENKDFNMIGLGDIVIPGVYVALMLRIDIYLYKKLNNNVCSGINFFSKHLKYFFATFIGYVVGIICTLIVMYVFNHAQPALLYLVPGTLIPSTLTAVLSGEFKQLWDYDEEKIQKDEMEKLSKKDDKKDDKKNDKKDNKKVDKKDIKKDNKKDNKKEKKDDDEKARVSPEEDDDEKERVKEKND